MRYLSLPALDRRLSQLVLGSMVFHTDALENSFALLDAWREAGGNTVDCAHVYAGGASERAFGRWLEARGCRAEMVILTKGAHPSADRQRVTPEDITCDLRDSLARLRTDYVDLYVLHRDDPSLPVGPIVEALNAQVDAGRIRAFGGSNWTPERLDEANGYAAAHGLRPFSVSSPNLSLAVAKEPVWAGCISATDPASREWYTRTQMPLFAWSSQARGFFTGAFNAENVRSNELMTRVYDNPENWERLRRATELGGKRGFKAIEVALGWVLHQPFPVFPLIGPANVEELRSSLRALELELSPEEVRWLNLEPSAA